MKPTRQGTAKAIRATRRERNETVRQRDFALIATPSARRAPTPSPLGEGRGEVQPPPRGLMKALMAEKRREY